jgi:hypothetical protein
MKNITIKDISKYAELEDPPHEDDRQNTRSRRARVVQGGRLTEPVEKKPLILCSFTFF